MTSKLDVVKAWLAQPISDNEARMAYIAEDFQNVDYDYKASEVREEGDAVIMTGHFEGTHTADIDLSLLGAGVVPASGKKIVWPEWSTKITVGQAKITRMEPYGEGGGMEAFLAPLGVKPPSK